MTYLKTSLAMCPLGAAPFISSPCNEVKSVITLKSLKGLHCRSLEYRGRLTLMNLTYSLPRHSDLYSSHNSEFDREKWRRRSFNRHTGHRYLFCPYWGHFFDHLYWKHTVFHEQPFKQDGKNARTSVLSECWPKLNSHAHDNYN